MATGRLLEVERELLEAFERNGRVNEYLIKVLPRRLWHAPPPSGRGRSMAAIAAHMQSVRRSFARMGGARPGPPSLDRRRVTPAEARRALRQSTCVLLRQFETALTTRQPRVKGTPRRTVDLITYLMQHDAHHRGQICVLVRNLGAELSADDVMRIWGWKALPPLR